jgi:hypothetical protein
MSSLKKERIDILVPCHSYLNKSVDGVIHPPVFLFLYNEAEEKYEKINITDVGDSEHKAGQGVANLRKVEKNHNIHIKFIDKYLNEGDEDEYQLATIDELVGLNFDYIFPIHCPGRSHLDYLPFLKPEGKLLELDARVEPHFLKTRDEATQTAYKASIIKSRPAYPRTAEDGRPQIEFHEYMASHEPYIYKEALDHELYYGWYKIYTSPNADSKKSGGKRKSLKKRKSIKKRISKGKRKSISKRKRVKRKTRRVRS